ncbi:hypothetical protein FHR89_000067 [Cellulomonas uda]|nr:hypothetical protein [Cellulomonas uda]
MATRTATAPARRARHRRARAGGSVRGQDTVEDS